MQRRQLIEGAFVLAVSALLPGAAVAGIREKKATGGVTPRSAEMTEDEAKAWFAERGWKCRQLKREGETWFDGEPGQPQGRYQWWAASYPSPCGVSIFYSNPDPAFNSGCTELVKMAQREGWIEHNRRWMASERCPKGCGACLQLAQDVIDGVLQAEKDSGCLGVIHISPRWPNWETAQTPIHPWFAAHGYEVRRDLGGSSRVRILT